jgi:hypothetical protein
MKVKTLIAVALFVLCASAALAQFEHPDLKAGKKKVRSMVLMPVQVEITKVGMKGAEPMIEESRQTEQELTPVIGTVLHNLGYKLDMESLSRATLEKDSDLRYTVDDLRS